MQAFGTGFDGYAWAAAVLDRDPIVGGEFTHHGSNPMGAIARYTPDGWQALGGGLGGGYVAARGLAVRDHQLFVTGDFSTAGGSPANNIARWDGSAWVPLGSGLSIG